ncbi:histone-fold-containing protein [Fomitopsis betulina]|nr:histone-fold-containing protein [Fomitopsis betulina]
MKNKNKTTKFPVARIKRIMQKDEEVGKVAQATPIVISKALELFLAMIIDEASKVTLDRGSKRVEAYHLKHAVETVDMLDFLKEIVEAVPDPSAGGTIDLDPDTTESGRKRRGGKGKRASAADGEEGAAPAPRRRRKKGEAKEEGEGEGEEEKPEDDDQEMEEENDTGGEAGPVRRDEYDDDDWEG